MIYMMNYKMKSTIQNANALHYNPNGHFLSAVTSDPSQSYRTCECADVGYYKQ